MNELRDTQSWRELQLRSATAGSENGIHEEVHVMIGQVDRDGDGEVSFLHVV